MSRRLRPASTPRTVRAAAAVAQAAEAAGGGGDDKRSQLLEARRLVQEATRHGGGPATPAAAPAPSGRTPRPTVLAVRGAGRLGAARAAAPAPAAPPPPPPAAESQAARSAAPPPPPDADDDGADERRPLMLEGDAGGSGAAYDGWSWEQLEDEEERILAALAALDEEEHAAALFHRVDADACATRLPAGGCPGCRLPSSLRVSLRNVCSLWSLLQGTAGCGSPPRRRVQRPHNRRPRAAPERSTRPRSSSYSRRRASPPCSTSSSKSKCRRSLRGFGSSLKLKAAVQHRGLDVRV